MRDTLPAAVVAGLYFVAVERFYPHDAFSLDSDEGINAIKALLLDHGYRLYDPVWNDQPPLFTHLLRGWFHLFGWDLVSGRLLTLLFAALLVFAVYDLVRRYWGHGAALVTVPLLLSSSYFIPLSVSLMIGLPCLACAMLSLWALVRWCSADRWGWLLASAMLMSGSLGIKLFTAFLVPLFAAWLLFVSWWRGRRHPWQPGVVWLLAVFAATALLFLAMAGRAGFDQLIAPHAMARSGEQFVTHGGFAVLATIVPFDLPLVILAGLGTLIVVTRRCWELALLPAWAGIALALLLLHAPVWRHHYLLLSVVAAPMGGVAVAEAFRSRRFLDHRFGVTRAVRIVRILSVVTLVITLLIMHDMLPGDPVQTMDRAEATLRAMERFASRTRMVFTDAPMYAFRAGLDAVPELAVVSLKRLATGNLTTDDLLASLQRHAPEQVLLTGRFPHATTATLILAMRGRYRLVFHTDDRPRILLYVRGDVVAALRAAG